MIAQMKCGSATPFYRLAQKLTCCEGAPGTGVHQRIVSIIGSRSITPSSSASSQFVGLSHRASA
jgi:hypothetical protein